MMFWSNPANDVKLGHASRKIIFSKWPTILENIAKSNQNNALAKQFDKESFPLFNFNSFLSTRIIEIAMAESFSEAAQSLAKEAIRATVSRGDFKFIIDADRATLNDTLRTMSSTAITLGAIYAGYKTAAKIIDGVVNVALGRRDDKEVQDIKPSGLHVLLHCSTNEKFLKVLEDFKSGRMKERLQLEFSFAKIVIEGLVVKLENVEEVEEIVAVINGLKM